MNLKKYHKELNVIPEIIGGRKDLEIKLKNSKVFLKSKGIIQVSYGHSRGNMDRIEGGNMEILFHMDRICPYKMTMYWRKMKVKYCI